MTQTKQKYEIPSFYFTKEKSFSRQARREISQIRVKIALKLEPRWLMSFERWLFLLWFSPNFARKKCCCKCVSYCIHIWAYSLMKSNIIVFLRIFSNKCLNFYFCVHNLPYFLLINTVQVNKFEFLQFCVCYIST